MEYIGLHLLDNKITHRVPLTKDLYEFPYNDIRRCKIMLLGDVFWHYDMFRNISYTDRINLLKKIERVCFNYSIDRSDEENIIASWDNELFSNIYNSTCYKISSNIEPNGLVNNRDFAENILNGSISIESLPKLNSHDIFPKKYKSILNRIEASKNIKLTIKTTTMYKCGKCYKNQCTVENLYNRSLDEGVNLRVTCVNCGFAFNA